MLYTYNPNVHCGGVSSEKQIHFIKMGQTASSSWYGLQPKEVQEIQSLCRLSEPQIIKLYARYRQLDKDKSGCLTRDELISIPVSTLLYSVLIIMNINLYFYSSFYFNLGIVYKSFGK